MSFPDGTKVFVKHTRWVPPSEEDLQNDPQHEGYMISLKTLRENGDTYSPRGGITEALVVLPDGREETGVAICRTDENFSYMIGRNIAIGRAKRELGLILGRGPRKDMGA